MRCSALLRSGYCRRSDAGILSRKALAFLVIAGQLKRTIEQLIHINFFSNHLAGRGSLSFADELRRRNSSGVRLNAFATLSI